MPPPAAIVGMRQAVHDVGAYPIAFANPQGGGGRAQITRTFHTYLEIGMQSKHCELMRGYCRQQNVEARRADGTQVRHAQVATAQSVLGVGGLYRQCAQTAATVVKDHMVARWSYDGPDIYVLFHCYPSR